MGRRSNLFNLETSGKVSRIRPGTDEKGNRSRVFISDILHLSKIWEVRSHLQDEIQSALIPAEKLSIHAGKACFGSMFSLPILKNIEDVPWKVKSGAYQRPERASSSLPTLFGR